MIEVSFRPKIEEGPTAISSDTSWKEVTVQEGDVLRGEEMIRRHTGAVGTIIFVVRRPGTQTPFLVVRSVVIFLNLTLCVFLCLVT